MKFYHYRQNNSGGSFDVTETLCHHLFIEAENESFANARALDLGIYFDGCETGMDCECCGDRWYTPDMVDLKRVSKAFGRDFKTIEDYATYYANDMHWTSPEARVFYANGKVVKIENPNQ